MGLVRQQHHYRHRHPHHCHKCVHQQWHLDLSLLWWRIVLMIVRPQLLEMPTMDTPVIQQIHVWDEGPDRAFGNQVLLNTEWMSGKGTLLYVMHFYIFRYRHHIQKNEKPIVETFPSNKGPLPQRWGLGVVMRIRLPAGNTHTHAYIYNVYGLVEETQHIYIYTRDRCWSPVTTKGWFGVGWGGVVRGWDDNVPCTCTHLWCYACVSWSVVTTVPKIGWAKSNQTCVGAACLKETIHYSYKYKRIQVIAAAALHRKPRIMSVQTALQLYRNDCSRGTISIAPKDTFVPESLTWLD